MAEPSAPKANDKPAAPAEDKGAVASVETELAASAERIRETAKWLVAAFGAVAAALITGLQLSDLGQLEGTNRTLAAIGVAAALAAVVLIIALASTVLAAGRVALSDLAGTKPKKHWLLPNPRKRQLVEELQRSPGLFPPDGTADTFTQRINEEWKKQTTNWLAMQTSTDPEERLKAEQAFKETKGILPELNKLARRVLAHAQAEDVRLLFRRVRVWIVCLALVAAAGAGLFAYENTLPKDEEQAEPAVAERPVLVTVDLTESGEEKLKSTVGGGCNLNQVPALAIASSETDVDVISLPERGCKLAEFSVEEDDGEVQPATDVTLDIPPL
jgi:hypothetical protein